MNSLLIHAACTKKETNNGQHDQGGRIIAGGTMIDKQTTSQATDHRGITTAAIRNQATDDYTCPAFLFSLSTATLC